MSTEASPAHQHPTPKPPTPVSVCPYCGEATGPVDRCPACRGFLDLLSRQATQNQMGAWSLLTDARRGLPGRSYEALVALARAKRLTPTTVVRGPTTHQFWMLAREAPGVAHLVGRCHACGRDARADSLGCDGCGVSFQVAFARDSLGLGAVRLLPGHADPATVAAAAFGHAPRGFAPGAHAPDDDMPMLSRAGKRRASWLPAWLPIALGAGGLLALGIVGWRAIGPAEPAQDAGQIAGDLAEAPPRAAPMPDPASSIPSGTPDPRDHPTDLAPPQGDDRRAANAPEPTPEPTPAPPLVGPDLAALGPAEARAMLRDLEASGSGDPGVRRYLALLIEQHALAGGL